MVTRLFVNVLFGLAALVLLGGCTARSISDEPIIFDAAGPVEIDVESFNGDVNIYVDDSLDQASVQVVRMNDYGTREPMRLSKTSTTSTIQPR